VTRRAAFGVLVALLAAGCAAAPAPLRLGEGDDGRSLTVPVGTVIELRLAERPGTGYSWAAGPTPLTPLGVSHEPASGPPGAAGAVIFRYRVDAAGPARLDLKHWRVWLGEPSVTRRVGVTIDGQPAP
jgi:predicted secreted protein